MPPEFSTRESPLLLSRGGWVARFFGEIRRMSPTRSRGAPSNDFAAMQGGRAIAFAPSCDRDGSIKKYDGEGKVCDGRDDPDDDGRWRRNPRLSGPSGRGAPRRSGADPGNLRGHRSYPRDVRRISRRGL